MGMLSDSDLESVRERLKKMTGAVKIVNFTQEIECRFCRETRSFLEDVASLSDKISLEVFNFVTDSEQVKSFNIDKIPATVLMNGGDHGIKYYGIPSGYEFSSLLDDILMVSSGDSGLSQDTRDALASLTDPMHLQVFVTPT